MMSKANASPCGAVCPRRDLPGCRKVCKEWQEYEAANLAKYNSKQYTAFYRDASTAGSIRRMVINTKLKNKKWRGPI